MSGFMYLLQVVESSWRRKLRWLVWLAAILVSPSGLAGKIGPGHSAVWYDPDRNGEGWVLEILADDRALLNWYTYDEEGGQRWLQSIGAIQRGDGTDEISFPELYLTRGGRFGPNFDPSDVEFEVVGQANIAFSDCQRGELSYSAFGQTRTINIRRLSTAMGLRCDPIHGVPGEPVQEYAGQSGSWFDLSHNGEGFSWHWMSRNEAVLSWYSYDAEGNQYWMIGTGSLVGNEIVFPELNSARGAKFGDEFDPDDVELINWGSLVMTLDCDAGTAHYESNLPAFGSGSFELTRLTQFARLNCPWTQPKFTDLYSVEWKELPIEPNVVGSDNNIQAASVSNNGEVAAHRVISGRSSLTVWKPAAAQWISDPLIMSLQDYQIAPDGTSVIGSDSPGQTPAFVRTWTEADGWQAVSQGLVLDESIHYGASQDLSRIVGTGRITGDPVQDGWVWGPTQGQELLLETEELRAALPTAVSDDGSQIIGITLRVPPEGLSRLQRVATRWVNGSDPISMKDMIDRDLEVSAASSADGAIVFGHGQADYHLDDHPNFGQSWFWKSDQEMAYLGPPPPDSVAQGYAIGDVTADGSLAVGRYQTSAGIFGLIWTQDTGLVPIAELVSELGIGDMDWAEMNARDVSPDGSKILLSGRRVTNQIEPRHWRAVVLELVSK